MNPLYLGMLHTLALVNAQSAYHQALKRLDQLGLHLHFSRIPPGWIAAIQLHDWSDTWQAAGLGWQGVGYSTIGTLVEGTRTASRFWPTSPYYQARLGGYLIEAEQAPPTGQGSPPAADLVFQPLMLEQLAWLRNYGCPNPQASLTQAHPSVSETTHQDYPAWIFEGTMITQSDVGAHNRSTNNYLNYRTYELLFARFGGVHLPHLCTLPPIWPLASYHTMELDCLVLLIPIPGHPRWALLYCCAARWAGRAYFPQLRDEALSALQNVRIVST